MKKNFIISLLFAVGLLTKNYADEILIFSPMPNEAVLKTDVLIAASYYDMGGVSTDRVQLYLDGVEISDRAEVEPEMVSYAPSMINPGTHRVKVMIFRDGMDPLEKQWSFNVAGKKKWTDEVEWNGKASSDYRGEKVGDNNLTVGNFGLFFKGTAYDWFRFSTNIKMASDEDPLIQPRSRYTLKLSFSRFLDLGFGDTNPRYSRFTLDGKRIRGVSANLKLGVLNFQYVKGELLREIDGSLAENASYNLFSEGFQDSLAVYRLNRQGYTFNQNISASRLSFGSGKIFQWGMSFIKVKDDINSVNAILGDAKVLNGDTTGVLATGTYTIDELMALNGEDVYGDGSYSYNIYSDDPTDWKGATPKDNVVLGSDIGFYLDHKRVLLEGEFAFSLLNKDIWDGALSLSQMDTLLDDSLDNSLAGSLDLDVIPFDPRDIEDFFVIGFNMVPLAPIDVAAFGDSATVSIGEALVNMPSLSYRSRIKLNYFGNYLTAEYSRVGPEFKSLANPYLISGWNQTVLSDRIQLFKNRILLSVEYRHKDDDVLTSVANVTNENRIMTNLTIIPGPGLPTVSFGYRNIGRENGITTIDELTSISGSDTTYSYKDNREEWVATNITSSITYVFDAFNSRHSLFATIVSYDKKDQITDREADPDFIDPKLTSSVFNITATSRFGFIPLKTNLSFTTNESNFSIAPNQYANQKFNSMKLDGEYSLFNKTITALGGVSFMNGQGAQELSQVGFRGGIRLRIIEDLSAQFIMNVRNKTFSGEASTEYTGLATLSYLF